MSEKLPVLFVGLGGTRIAAGALPLSGRYLRTDDVLWRHEPRFADAVTDSGAARFCDALVGLADVVVRRASCEWPGVGTLGVGFPGPEGEGKWYSNNLGGVFQRGVALGAELSDALLRHAGDRCRTQVRVVFDAQCDAGGEVNHPSGRFYPRPRAQPKGTVLNLATGVAAAFVSNGRVLIGDEDFHCAVGQGFDGGSGQIGRHLWYRPANRGWEYHYRRHGDCPEVPGAIRMTEFLSGPAIAARALPMLGEAGLLPPVGWLKGSVSGGHLRQLSNSLANEPDPACKARLLRDSELPVSTAVLMWVDQLYADADRAPEVIEAFARSVARDLADAIQVWSAVPEWTPYLSDIVLTGGVGIHLLSSGDDRLDGGLMGLLCESLGADVRVRRSRLADNVERGLYLFMTPGVKP